MNWLNWLVLLAVSASLSTPKAQGLEAKPSSRPGAPFRILFLNPANHIDPFWSKLQKVMEAACGAFNCTIKTTFAERDRGLMVRQLRNELSKGPHPDFVIYQSLKDNGGQIIEICEAARIHNFMFNSGLSPKRAEKLGAPRARFRHWLGSLMPDDEAGGYHLARDLILEHKKMKPKEKTINLIAIAGNDADQSGMNRTQGLMRALSEFPEVKLLQIVPGYWEAERTFNIMPQVFQRYPDPQIIWAASDAMALGAIKYLKSVGIKPKALIGGINWDRSAMTNIEEGYQTISYGGHYWDAVWVIALLKRYSDKNDFNNMGLEFKSSFARLDRSVSPELRAIWATEKKLTSFPFEKLQDILNQGPKTFEVAQLLTLAPKP